MGLACLMPLAASLTAAPYWPFVVLIIGMSLVIFLIVQLRLHAFLALMLAAITVGLISPDLRQADGLSAMVEDSPRISHLILAVEAPMREFGRVAGQVGFVIALAAIIGAAMLQSGAADCIVNRLIDIFGERRAPVALIAASVLLAIPVFFDTVFFLMIPLAQALYHRTGQRYLMFVLAIAGGAALTHHLAPPTPGPLVMAATLRIDLGVTIVAGLCAAAIPSIAVYFLAEWISKIFDLPYRGASRTAAEETVAADAAYCPSLTASLSPIVLPVFLISLATIARLMIDESLAMRLLDFFGNKNVAMFLGTLLAIRLWARRKEWKIRQIGDAMGSPLQVAGIIILITCAGGAFGAMIKHAGVGDAVKWATQGMEVNYILLAWLIAAVMKTAQGSGTVSMITTSSIMLGILEGTPALPFHPVYILLAIGFGAMFVSWMNDSGFWVVAQLGGFTERETLATWTVLLACVGLLGLGQLLIASQFFPLAPD